MEKAELIDGLEGNRQELIEMLEGLPDEIMMEPGVIGDWSIKDILAHLTFWEGQIVTLLFQAQHGVEKPSTAHFGAETVDETNQRWYKSSKERPLDIIWQDWMGVRKQSIRRVSEFKENDLNDPQRFAWLRGIPLSEWILNDTINHEEEHADQIREWLDQQDENLGQTNDRNNP